MTRRRRNVPRDRIRPRPACALQSIPSLRTVRVGWPRRSLLYNCTTDNEAPVWFRCVCGFLFLITSFISVSSSDC